MLCSVNNWHMSGAFALDSGSIGCAQIVLASAGGEPNSSIAVRFGYINATVGRAINSAPTFGKYKSHTEILRRIGMLKRQENPER